MLLPLPPTCHLFNEVIVVYHGRMRLICFMGLLGCLSTAEARGLHSYALVRDDASLLIKGKVIHLYGIYTPPTERQCQTRIRPVRCASRAALALEFKIQGFVHCFQESTNPDRSWNATCYVGRSHFDEGMDLGAYLIERGWALALPHAPFEYHALEKIARYNQSGVWGFSVDSVQR